MIRFFANTAALAAILVMAGACIKMGPDYKAPQLGFDVPEAYQHDPGKTTLEEPEDTWWRIFADPEIDRIVQLALQHNYDIKRATATILQVRAQFIETRADRFPQLDFEGHVQRQRQSISSFSSFDTPGFSINRDITTYNLSFPATFELDLWGRLARSQEAAFADLMSAEANRHTVTQSIVAEAITYYLQMESVERRIQIAQDRIDSFRRSVELVENRYNRGLTSSLDVRQARRALAASETLLPSLLQELGTTQQNLSVLLGHYPRTRQPREQPADYFKALPPVPPGLPSQLLLRRPDIQAAEAQLKAANARIGAAKANRFPRITLTGNLGYSSTELEQIVTPESQLWNLAATTVQPLFDAGKRKAAQRQAEAVYRQTLADYAKTVLTAFAEVEQALLTRREQLEQRKRALVLLKEARAAQQVAQLRYQRGLVDYLNVLDAQRTRYDAEDEVVLTDLNILTNRVSLHRALGGSWATLPPVPPSEAHPLLEYFPP